MRDVAKRNWYMKIVKIFFPIMTVRLLTTNSYIYIYARAQPVVVPLFNDDDPVSLVSV